MPLLLAVVDLTLPISEPVLIVAIAVGIFLVAPMLVERARLPGIVGLIVAGALVGPNGFNLLARSNTIVLLGTVGLLYLMFMAGVEIDLHGFKRYRNRSLIFGALTFLLPQVVGTAVMLALGYGWAAAILIASMFASHTLLAYPIATRFGIGKSQAVTTAVGGTIITDTAALLVLAVVAASTRGTLDAAFWIRLVVLLTLYVAAIWYGLPWVARRVFRNERTGAGSEYLFVLLALFGGAFLAEVAGVEAIVGAFLVGLSLNRLIPEHGLLANRLHFFGDTFFIPFFLLSVGMLVDVRVLAGSPRAWVVMVAMTVTVTVTKWVAAMLTRRLFGFSREEGWVMFGLSVAQAAATLAAALVGREIGLIDDTVLNGVILMILATVVIGPMAVERYGRRLALQEAEQPYQPGQAPQRIMVPMAKPASAPALMDLALAIREPESAEPIFPLTVVPADPDRSAEFVALGERMLAHAAAHAAGVGVAVVPVTRVDDNFAHGIARGMTETRTSTVVIGWDGRRYASGGMFGSVLDRVLEQTREQVLVAKLGHPLNTTERLVVVIPQGTDHVPGFFGGVRLLKLMANRLGATVHAVVVGADADAYREHLRRVRPAASVTAERVERWGEAFARLGALVRKDDLVVVLSARRGALSWTPALDRLPGRMAALAPESFVMLYLAERDAQADAVPGAGPAPDLLVRPEHVLLNVPRDRSALLVRDLLASEFDTDVGRLQDVVGRVLSSDAEPTRGDGTPVILRRAAIPELRYPLLFLATSAEGVMPPGLGGEANLVLLLLTPKETAVTHQARLSALNRLVDDPDRVEALVRAGSWEELHAVVQTAHHAGPGEG